ncbi:MAG: uroporphyrinogen decarboxylase family protein [Kiritimatiellia bacterium]
MTRRERLRRCYFHLELDRPAVYSRRGFPANDATYDRLQAYLNSFSELKTGWPGTQLDAAYNWDVTSEPHSSGFARRIKILHTPLGDLRCSFLDSLTGQPGLQESYLVNSPDDAEKYLSLPLPGISGDPATFFAADAAMGDQGIVDVGLGFNPGGFVANLCGSENFAIMSATDRDIIHRLCERQTTIIVRRLKRLLAAKVGPYFSMAGEEYIVPPLHGPRDFNDFNVKYDKPIIDLVHGAGGRIHIHSHGSIKNVFQGFLEMGADVLHPFEPPPQGDILAREAKLLARGKMCLEGNLQINRMYEASADDIRRETAQLISDAFDDHRGLIVSPSASPYIRGWGEQCFPQYKAMIDTVLAFGR